VAHRLLGAQRCAGSPSAWVASLLVVWAIVLR
jgi:hypothetical protein